MINYNKNNLINTCLGKYYETFACTLDTADFVPEKYNKRILAYIFKNMRRQFKRIDKADKSYQKDIAKKERLKAKQAATAEKQRKKEAVAEKKKSENKITRKQKRQERKKARQEKKKAKTAAKSAGG